MDWTSLPYAPYISMLKYDAKNVSAMHLIYVVVGAHDTLARTNSWRFVYFLLLLPTWSHNTPIGYASRCRETVCLQPCLFQPLVFLTGCLFQNYMLHGIMHKYVAGTKGLFSTQWIRSKSRFDTKLTKLRVRGSLGRFSFISVPLIRLLRTAQGCIAGKRCLIPFTPIHELLSFYCRNNACHLSAHSRLSLDGVPVWCCGYLFALSCFSLFRLLRVKPIYFDLLPSHWQARWSLIQSIGRLRVAFIGFLFLFTVWNRLQRVQLVRLAEWRGFKLFSNILLGRIE